ncbi:MAG: transglutaminase-like cysteine peptidase [Gammaproteobacteria bacterium]|nr:transglutaminase-like cysteine peptidase [Gammaproteobacteria bacterium]
MLIAFSSSARSGQIEQLTDQFIAEFAKRYGNDARTRVIDWRRIMVENGSSADATKREIVNQFFNRIPWLEDAEHWGLTDYWATPLEMLGTNGGDCEDYSIAKYFTLIEMNVPGSQLLITYVRAPALKQSHMVLAYYASPDADPLILDNLVGEIRRGSERTDLIPVYSFNGDGLWVAVQRSLGRNVGNTSSLAQWQDVLRRMETEKSRLN